MQFETVIFDFDGVLCHDWFFNGFETSHPHIWEFIQTQIFGSAEDLVGKWMRGKLSGQDICSLIAKGTDDKPDLIMAELVRSVKEMRMEQGLIQLARDLQLQNRNVALVTNNMDIFNEVTVVHHKFAEVFPVIVNSCDHGGLKHELDGKLFREAFEMLGLTDADFEHALLIDDSAKARGMFERLGGQVFAYEDYDGFVKWMEGND